MMSKEFMSDLICKESKSIPLIYSGIQVLSVLITEEAERHSV